MKQLARNVGLIAAMIVIGLIAAYAIFWRVHKMPTASTSNGLSSTSMEAEFTINANDSGADHESITVKKNATVSITFAVDASGVYHGGLEFKSVDPGLDSGPIAPGTSKTISFSATKSFSFQPYWYASGVKKDYLIQINVN